MSMFVTQEKGIVGKKSTRLQRMQSHREAYQQHMKAVPVEQTDIAQSELFKTMFKRWGHLRNQPSK